MTLLTPRRARQIAIVSVLLAAVLSVAVASADLAVDWLFAATFGAALVSGVLLWGRGRQRKQLTVTNQGAMPRHWRRWAVEEPREAAAEARLAARSRALAEASRQRLEFDEQLHRRTLANLDELARERSHLLELREALWSHTPRDWRGRRSAGSSERMLQRRLHTLDTEVQRVTRDLQTIEERMVRGREQLVEAVELAMFEPPPAQEPRSEQARPPAPE